MPRCSAFLTSVLDVSIHLRAVSKKSDWFFSNSQMITYKAQKNIFLCNEFYFISDSSSHPWWGGLSSFSGYKEFPGGRFALTLLPFDEVKWGSIAFSLQGTWAFFIHHQREQQTGHCNYILLQEPQPWFSSCEQTLLEIMCWFPQLRVGD